LRVCKSILYFLQIDGVLGMPIVLKRGGKVKLYHFKENEKRFLSVAYKLADWVKGEEIFFIRVMRQNEANMKADDCKAAGELPGVY